MILTRDNYHSVEADAAYFNASQVKAYRDCPAAWADLYLSGKPVCPREDSKEAFLQGWYLETDLLEPHLLPALREKYRNDLFTKTSLKEAAPVPAQPARYHKTITDKLLEEAKPEVPGDDSKLVLLAPYAKAVEAKRVLLRQPLVRAILDGAEFQKIVTGTIGGLEFRTMLDIWRDGDNMAWDLKFVEDTTGKEWDQQLRRYMHYWYDWGYHLQLAVQHLLTGARVGLLVIDKRDPAGMDLLELTGDELANACREVTEMAMAMYAARESDTPQRRCGRCDYCRMTAQLTIKKMEWT